MAIIKTTFTGTTRAENGVEVLAWLQANATEYFDEITSDASGNIQCKIEGFTAVLIGFDAATETTFYLSNGTYQVSKASGSSFFSAAIKTTKGIQLVSNYHQAGDIFISKSDVGSTCMSTFCYGAGAYNTFGYIFADFVHSANFYIPYSDGNNENAKNHYTHSASNTSITHAVFDGGFYAPDLYIATFSQYARLACVFSIDNKKYTTDGVIVLAD